MQRNNAKTRSLVFDVFPSKMISRRNKVHSGDYFRIEQREKVISIFSLLFQKQRPKSE